MKIELPLGSIQTSIESPIISLITYACNPAPTCVIWRIYRVSNEKLPVSNRTYKI